MRLHCPKQKIDAPRAKEGQNWQGDKLNLLRPDKNKDRNLENKIVCMCSNALWFDFT